MLRPLHTHNAATHTCLEIPCFQRLRLWLPEMREEGGVKHAFHCLNIETT